MGLKRTDEFGQDAVRIALTSGLTRNQVASDLLPAGHYVAMSREGGRGHADAEQMDHRPSRHGRGYKNENLSITQENGRLRRGVQLFEKERGLWTRWRNGESLSDIGRALCKRAASVPAVVVAKGGIASATRRRRRPDALLPLPEREESSRGLVCPPFTAPHCL